MSHWWSAVAATKSEDDRQSISDLFKLVFIKIKKKKRYFIDRILLAVLFLKYVVIISPGNPLVFFNFFREFFFFHFSSFFCFLWLIKNFLNFISISKIWSGGHFVEVVCVDGFNHPIAHVFEEHTHTHTHTYIHIYIYIYIYIWFSFFIFNFFFFLFLFMIYLQNYPSTVLNLAFFYLFSVLIFLSGLTFL